MTCGLIAGYFLMRRKKKQQEAQEEERKLGVALVTDKDPSRYKSAVVPPRFPGISGRSELEGSPVHEMDAGSCRWVGERRASPRLDDPRNEYER